jgi:heme/copper-type cytochrome/quinol oxidase subunit 4
MTEQMSEEVVEYPLCVILTIVTIVLKKKDINLPTSTTLIRVLSQVIQVFISACAQFGAKQKYKESVVNVMLYASYIIIGHLTDCCTHLGPDEDGSTVSWYSGRDVYD